ncbi:MAG: gamma carbonic anhydrase family protein [bacterium]|nr:gamma carbonic anhydrase family protein [bacterium]
MILPYKGIEPRIHRSVFVAPSADIIGDVTVGEDSSIWFGVIIRGDVHYIRIGDRTNIQDGSLLHVTKGTHPLVLMDGVTVGHGVTLHGCTIHSNTLIGIGSIILDGAEISENTLIGAGSLVTEGTHVPPGVLAFGRPAKAVRDLTEKETAWFRRSAANYVAYKEDYLNPNKEG